MALITPDFSEANDKVIEVGLYNTRITKTDLKTSQAGNQYVQWTLDIFGAEGDYAQFNNRKVWHNTMCSGTAAGMLRKFVKAATGEDPTAKFDSDDLIGREIAVTIGHRNYEGNIQADVKAVQQII